MAELGGLPGDEFQMWMTFAFILGTLILYASERIPAEVASIGVICVLMIFFHFEPVSRHGVANTLSPERMLSGLANPALITVLALLVIGQGMVRTGMLERGARLVLRVSRGNASVSIALTIVIVLAVSAFLNNIPVVVIFIPIMQVLADRLGQSVSKVMMGLSFAAVLGGMTTLIGSGTNLLVSSALIQAGERPFGFFDFTVPGLALAFVGLLYVLFVTPRLLPDRTSLDTRITERSGKYFLAQITVTDQSLLIGDKAVGGALTMLPDVRVRMILRGGESFRPPFHDFEVEAGDVIMVAAGRKALAEAMCHDPGLLQPARPTPAEISEKRVLQPWEMGERVMAEVMVPPGSNLEGWRLRQIGFHFRTRCVALGLQRSTRIFSDVLTEIPLAAGDVLLIQGRPEDIKALRADRDVVLLEWSTEELPVLRQARPAALIFLAVVACAASGVVPVVTAAVSGAVAMVLFGVLNIRQAFRALDSKIVTMIPAALALGAAMQETGGAAYLAHQLNELMGWAGPWAMLSGFFLLTAVMANIISSKACAVLFTPIAVGLARELGVDPRIFAVAVVFAANSAFATPIGYQTSLLVMGPGHYRFSDFARAGAPLIVLLWLVFTFAAPLYWDI